MNRILKNLLVILLIASTTAYAEEGSEVDIGLQNQAELIKKAILAEGPKFTLIGEITKGQSTEYSINGEDFVVDSDARISGDLRIGAFANVRGDRLGNRNYAKKILIDDGKGNEPLSPAELDSDSNGARIRGLPGQKIPD